MNNTLEIAVTCALAALFSVPTFAAAPDTSSDIKTRKLDVVEAGRFEINGFKIEGNTLIDSDSAQQLVAPFIGPDKSLADIHRATSALREAYVKAGYPVVKVLAPEQTATDGQITLQVIEGKVRSINILGNQQFSADNIRNSLPPLQKDINPNAPKLVAAIAMANEGPAKQVAVNFQSGEQPGDINAVVNVSEDRPQKFTAAYDNSGSRSSGEHKLTLGYQNANLFDRDHMLSAQVGTALDEVSKGFNVALGYRVPLYAQGLSLDLIAAYSDSSNIALPAGAGDMNGTGTMLAARINQPFPSFGEYRHKLIYGLDYKDFDNTCAGLPCGTITSQPISLTYQAQYTTPAYQLSGNVGLAINIPGGPHGSRAEYTATSRSERNWSALRFNASAGLPLHGDWQLRFTLNGQYTTDRVIPAEEFGVGGANSVRGYSERAISGDKGLSGNIELYTPDFGKHLPIASASLRGQVFLDAGTVSTVDALPGEDARQNLSSLGAGVRFGRGRDLTAKLDVGIALKDLAATPGTGVSRDSGDIHAHLAVNYAF